MKQLLVPADTKPFRRRRVKQAPAAEGLADTHWLCQLLHIATPTFWRWLAAGKIGPSPTRFGPRCIRWKTSECLAWIANGCPNRQKWDAMQATA
jgi:predicted DNA-binding transcriptional regulator AlpA